MLSISAFIDFLLSSATSAFASDAAISFSRRASALIAISANFDFARR
jgi:hypothetical protein